MAINFSLSDQSSNGRPRATTRIRYSKTRIPDQRLYLALTSPMVDVTPLSLCFAPLTSSFFEYGLCLLNPHF